MVVSSRNALTFLAAQALAAKESGSNCCTDDEKASVPQAHAAAPRRRAHDFQVGSRVAHASRTLGARTARAGQRPRRLRCGISGPTRPRPHRDRWRGAGGGGAARADVEQAARPRDDGERRAGPRHGLSLSAGCGATVARADRTARQGERGSAVIQQRPRLGRGDHRPRDRTGENLPCAGCRSTGCIRAGGTRARCGARRRTLDRRIGASPAHRGQEYLARDRAR